MAKIKPASRSRPAPKALPVARSRPAPFAKPQLAKAQTGIQGLDQITGGGLPQGRPTLVCGGAGCGKTLLAMEFLVRGATQFNEPGVFMSFEETAKELTKNVASLGFDLKDLVARKMIRLESVYIESSDTEETGGYDLEALFLRLGYAIDSIGAKRVVLDTVESLFASLPNPMILRAELRRLFRWLKDRGVTSIITAESGDSKLTHHGLEEYVSDCVIVLDHRVRNQVSARRLRVVKYRGSSHGTNEFPFLIDEDGISLMPITALGLQQPASKQCMSTGIPRLDTMLGGAGCYLGSSMLISGTAGTGKSSFAASFANAACLRGERVLYFAMEESSGQIMRNMLSIGIDLQPHVDKGLLLFRASRPTLYGLEMHLTDMLKAIRTFKPKLLILDPLNSFVTSGNEVDVKDMLMRLADFLRTHQITGLYTSLTTAGSPIEHTDTAVSSQIDTWLMLRDIELGGERNRALSILKSRGMKHSNQTREFLITDHGVQVLDAYGGPGGVLTGSARLAQEASERAAAKTRDEEFERLRQTVERKRSVLEAQVAALRAEFEAEQGETLRVIAQEQARETQQGQDRAEMGRSRMADASTPKGKGPAK